MREPTFQYLTNLVRRHTGMVYPRERTAYMTQALRPLVDRLEAGTVDGLVEHLRQTPSMALVSTVVSALTVGETYFYRDAHVFSYLETRLLPQLLRRPRLPAIWSAACSSGQEAYSVALALASANRQHPLPRIILASDVDQAAVGRAREGVYTQFETSRGLSGFHRARWFRKDGDGHQRVRSELRDMIDFKVLSLCSSPLLISGSGLVDPRYPPVFDVILVRNVLIYMELEDRARVLEEVARYLAPDGTMLLGAAELLPPGTHGLRTVMEEGVTLIRKG